MSKCDRGADSTAGTDVRGVPGPGSLVDDVARVESGVVNLSHDLRTAGLEEEGELLGEVDPFKARSRTSTYEDPKPPWKPRKQAYLRHLPDELSAAGIRFASPLTPAGRSLRERTRPSAAAGAEVLRGETPRTPPLPPGEGEERRPRELKPEQGVFVSVVSSSPMFSRLARSEEAPHFV